MKRITHGTNTGVLSDSKESIFSPDASGKLLLAIVYVNLNNAGIWSSMLLPLSFNSSHTIRCGYFQNNLNGGGAYFTWNGYDINLKYAYLNGTDVTSKTTWICESIWINDISF